MAKKSLASFVSMYKSAKIKPLKVAKAKYKPFKQLKLRSSLKLRVGK